MVLHTRFTAAITPRYISPLLAALLTWATQSPQGARIWAAELASLVDRGYFSTPEMREEMLEYAEDGLSRRRFQGVPLIKNLFGNRVALTQLASRALVSSWFSDEEFGGFSEEDVAVVVHSRGIPSDVVAEFQVVLLKCRVLKAVREMDWHAWQLDEISLSEGDDFGESEEEYW